MRAQGKPITVAHGVSTFVYGQHLVARAKKFFEGEGLSLPGLGDSNHPLKATEKGRDTVILFATDPRCSYANIVVRKGLYDRGVKSVEARADAKLVGRKAVMAATDRPIPFAKAVDIVVRQEGAREAPRGIAASHR